MPDHDRERCNQIAHLYINRCGCFLARNLLIKTSMKDNIKLIAVVVSFLVITYIFFAATGCKKVYSDKLYAIKLAKPPTDTDWGNAVPLIVTASNGNFHDISKVREGAAKDIDKDTVHTSSASCHHGTPAPPPVKIYLKAYYTDSELFMRVSWGDATKDDRMYEFAYNNDMWRSSRQLEDALGIMWDMSGGEKPFNCAQACHATNWQLKNFNMVAKFRMQTLADDKVDLWNWKAYRTNSLNFADDKYIDEKGIAPDTPAKIYFYNSTLKDNAPLDNLALEVAPMEEGDSPSYDYNGMPVKKGYWMITGTAPGVRVFMPSGRRADVKARGEYKRGAWEVTLNRKLITNDSKDVTFDIKRNNRYRFGISVMDNTLTNHYAAKETLELVFIDS